MCVVVRERRAVALRYARAFAAETLSHVAEVEVQIGQDLPRFLDFQAKAPSLSLEFARATAYHVELTPRLEPKRRRPFRAPV